MNWQTFLTISHITGAVLGVGGATFAEIFLLKSAKDGKIDPTESAFLQTTYVVLRLGMLLLVLSGFGYLLFYRITGQVELLYQPKLWAKLTIVLVIVFNALLLAAGRIPLWLGSSLSLVSWYAAFILGAWRTLSASFWEIMIFYLLAVLAASLGLVWIRKVLSVKL